ncbi:MAG: hypothetical protein IPG93_19220 [Burkholderiales bacterium]|nr:hypothetical protein [Burkholderiales bacterium]
MRTDRSTYREIIGALGRLTLALAVCGSSATPVAAQLSECRVDFSRSGAQGGDLYVNDKNEAYVVARFADSRFDNTSEVFRLRNCKSIADGVTAKSNFEQTFRNGGFKEYALTFKRSKSLVNSIYGQVNVTLSAAGIEARVNTVTPERLAGLRALMSLVTLQQAVPASALEVIANDPQLELLESSEFAGVQPNAMRGDVLGRKYLSLPDEYKHLAGSQVHRVINDYYPSRLTDAVRTRLPNDQALAETLDAGFAQRMAMLPRTSGEAAINSGFAVVDKVRHHSPVVVKLYLSALAERASFDTLASGLRNVSAAESFKYDSPVRREVGALLDASYLRHLESRANSIAVASSGYDRLKELGFSSAVIRNRWTELVAERGNFDDIIHLAHAAKTDSKFSSEEIGRVAAIADAAVVKQVDSSQNRMAAIASAYLRLLAAGYGSTKVRHLYMETAIAMADFDAALKLHHHISADAEFRSEPGAIGRARELVARRYTEAVTAASDAQSAAVARDGLIKLDNAGLKTATAVNLCEATILQRGKFQDAVDVFRATHDWTLVDRLQALAKQSNELAALEAVAVQVVSSPAVLLEADFKFDRNSPQQTEQEHLGLLAQYTLNVDRRFSGSVTLKNRKSSPLALRYGTYRVEVVLTLTLNTMFERQSHWKGNADTTDSKSWEKRLKIIVSPDGKGGMSGDAQVDWGSMKVVSFKRGSQGGFDLEAVRDVPVAQISVHQIEVFNP